MAQPTNKTTKPSHHSSLISPPRTPNIITTNENFHTQQRSTVENFIILWLDANINDLTDNFNSTITELQHHVHCISHFTDPDECIDFVTNIKHEKIFLLISGTLGKIIVPLIRNLYQIDSIYIYCDNRSKHEKWANKEKKVKGVFRKSQPIRDAIRRDIRQCEDDLASFSILSSTYRENEKLNQSDQLFVYLQLLKEILIEMEHSPNINKDFAKFCYEQYEENNYQLRIIKEFHNDYQQSSSIWWYTRECFIYSMLNKAFRIRDMEILSKMGFFIRHIHQDIKRLHLNVNKQNRLVVYRGQGISEEDFHKILENQNGFLSFDNFLTATTDKDASLIYARSARDYHELTGVLFHIEIDRTKALFTPLDKLGYDAERERKILFSIKTIFRIRNVNQIQGGLWQIQLGLTSDENDQLNRINKLIQKNGPERLDTLITKLQMLGKPLPINEPQSTEMEIDPIVEEDARQMETVRPMDSEEIVVEQPPANTSQVESDV